MKRIISILLSSVLLATLVQAVTPKEKIKVGVILPLTGDAASVGEAFKNGIDLALTKIPTSTRDQMEFIYEDDGLLAKNSLSAFHKLSSTGNLDVLLNLSSGTGKALSPVAEQSKVSFLSVASDPEISEGKKYVFNFWVTPDQEVNAAIPEAIKRGYRKIARISSIQDGTFAIKSAFDKINNGRLHIVLDEEFASDVKDFKSFLTKLRAHPDVDAVMVILLPGQCGIFAKQARQMGYKKDLFGFEMFEDANEVKVSGNALVGQWYVNGDDPNNLFVNEYRKAYPKASLFGASNGNDAALLVASALEKGYTGDTFHQYLATLKDFSGALGVYSATGDNRFTLPAAIKVVTTTGFEKVYK